jgi:hypothetical protein
MEEIQKKKRRVSLLVGARGGTHNQTKKKKTKGVMVQERTQHKTKQTHHVIHQLIRVKAA